MTMTFKPSSWLILCTAAGGLAACTLAAAQESSLAPAPAPAVTPGPPTAKPAKSTAQIDAGEPRASTSAAATQMPRSAGKKAPGAIDRIELNTATVTGDREQPKVMYIVPWKKSDIGDLSGKPMNSLLDEALAPVDRDEFKREVAYYGAVNADVPKNAASHGTTQQGEK